MADFPELKPHETVLWEGRPDLGFRFGPASMAAGIFAVALILGCLGIATVVDRSMPGVYWQVLGPGLLLGAIIAALPLLLDRRNRAATRYRVTSQQVLIRQGKRLGRYPHPSVHQLRIDGDARKTITLGYDRRNRPIQIEHVEDADAVFDIFRDLARQDRAA